MAALSTTFALLAGLSADMPSQATCTNLDPQPTQPLLAATAPALRRRRQQATLYLDPPGVPTTRRSTQDTTVADSGVGGCSSADLAAGGVQMQITARVPLELAANCTAGTCSSSSPSTSSTGSTSTTVSKNTAPANASSVRQQAFKSVRSWQEGDGPAVLPLGVQVCGPDSPAQVGAPLRARTAPGYCVSVQLCLIAPHATCERPSRGTSFPRGRISIHPSILCFSPPQVAVSTMVRASYKVPLSSQGAAALAATCAAEGSAGALGGLLLLPGQEGGCTVVPAADTVGTVHCLVCASCSAFTSLCCQADDKS